MKDNLDIKSAKKIIKNAESIIIVSDKGTMIHGTTPEVLSMFSVLIRELNKKQSKKTLKEAFELGFKTDEELLETAIDKIKKLFEGEK